jgi:hypothetical protein
MHQACHDFLKRIKAQYPGIFRGRVLEAGSLDVNGSPRPYFTASEYIGLDWRLGPGVDQVGLIHEWTGRPDGYFDTVISTETLEHDPHWRESVAAMIRLVRVGGSVIITCAGPGRAPHYLETSPTVHDYYENRTFVEVLAQLGGEKFDLYAGEYDDAPDVFDTRVLAIGKR